MFRLWVRSWYKKDGAVKKRLKILKICNKLKGKLNYSIQKNFSTLRSNKELLLERALSALILRYEGEATGHSPIQDPTNFNIKSNNNLLNPFYVTGFCDAESSFIISVTRRASYKTGWGVHPIFKIKLHIRDLVLKKYKLILKVLEI